MEDLNNTSLVGRLTADSEIHSFENSDVIKFSVAVNNRGKKDENGKFTDKTVFITVKYFGKDLKKLNEYLTKGKTVSVSGHIDQDTWEKDGKKNYLTFVNADFVKILNTGKSEKSVSDSAKDSQPEPHPELQNEEGFPEDIPF